MCPVVVSPLLCSGEHQYSQCDNWECDTNGDWSYCYSSAEQSDTDTVWKKPLTCNRQKQQPITMQAVRRVDVNSIQMLDSN